MNKKINLPHSLIMAAWALVLGAIAPLLNTTMVNIAVTDLGNYYHSSLSIVQWIVTGYVLASAIAVPFSGWLINHFNGKKVYLFVEIMFGITSLACGLAWNISSLIIFRLLQGFSAGLIMPLLTTLLVSAAGEEGQKNLGKLIAIVGLPIVIGPVLGPVLGGVIIHYLSWQWMFFISVPLTLIAILVIYKLLPDFKPQDPQEKLDIFGVSLISLMSAAIIYGIVQASDQHNFLNTSTVTFVIIGLLLLVIYIFHAKKRKDHAVLPLSLFHYKNFSGVMISLFFAGLVNNGPMLLLPLFFQNLRGDSIIMTGLALLPQGIGMLVVRPTIGNLIDRIGARYITIISLIITLIGTIPFVFFDQHTSFIWIAITLFIRGIGISGITMPLMSDAFIGIPKNYSSQVSIGSRVMQNIGGAFGSAFLATIVASTMIGKAPSSANLANGYHAGFLWALISSIIIILPAMLLTNKLSKKNTF